LHGLRNTGVKAIGSKEFHETGPLQQVPYRPFQGCKKEPAVPGFQVHCQASQRLLRGSIHIIDTAAVNDDGPGFCVPRQELHDPVLEVVCIGKVKGGIDPENDHMRPRGDLVALYIPVYLSLSLSLDPAQDRAVRRHGSPDKEPQGQNDPCEDPLLYPPCERHQEGGKQYVAIFPANLKDSPGSLQINQGGNCSYDDRGERCPGDIVKQGSEEHDCQRDNESSDQR